MPGLGVTLASRVLAGTGDDPERFRDATQQWAEHARRWSPWPAEFYRRHRSRGHEHNESLRALAKRLLELQFDLRRLGRRYDETGIMHLTQGSISGTLSLDGYLGLADGLRRVLRRDLAEMLDHSGMEQPP